MTITPAQAHILTLGLDIFLEDPNQILEENQRRLVWILAQLAARAHAEAGNLVEMKAASDLAMNAKPPAEYIPLVKAAKMYDIPVPTLRWHVKKGNVEGHKKDGRTLMVEAHSLATWVSERSK